MRRLHHTQGTFRVPVVYVHSHPHYLVSHPQSVSQRRKKKTNLRAQCVASQCGGIYRCKIRKQMIRSYGGCLAAEFLVRFWKQACTLCGGWARAETQHHTNRIAARRYVGYSRLVKHKPALDLFSTFRPCLQLPHSSGQTLFRSHHMLLLQWSRIKRTFLAYIITCLFFTYIFSLFFFKSSKQPLTKKTSCIISYRKVHHTSHKDQSPSMCS